MTKIDTSTETVTKISDDLMMTARVGTDNVRHAQLMDDASNVINALQARIEGVEAKLAKAVDVIKHIINIAPEGDDDEWHIALDDAVALLVELEKPE
jgi:C4-dicarboxylate-specific signal transduction histidine kinase